MPLPSTPRFRVRHSFEARSVQMIAAWSLAMAGAGTMNSLATSRTSGAATAPVATSAPGNALPPLPARLPRK